MESFFAVLKSEFFHLNKFGNLDELQSRPHQTEVKRIEPVQYRTRPLAAQQIKSFN